MKKTYCDCCGTLIPDKPPLHIAPGVELDLCPECRDLENGMGLRTAVVHELQRMRDDRLKARVEAKRYLAERETQELEGGGEDE